MRTGGLAVLLVPANCSFTVPHSHWRGIYIVMNMSFEMWVSYKRFYLHCSLQLFTIGECGYTIYCCYRFNTLVSFYYYCTVLHPLFASSSQDTSYMHCHHNSCSFSALSHCLTIHNNYAARPLVACGSLAWLFTAVTLTLDSTVHNTTALNSVPTEVAYIPVSHSSRNFSA
jgi:hypothetical protein